MEGLGKPRQKNSDFRCYGRDSNPAPFEYQSRALLEPAWCELVLNVHNRIRFENLTITNPRQLGNMEITKW